VTVFLIKERITARRVPTSRIDRSMPIVAETEQITDRRNSYLESRARISDGPGRRFFVMRSKNYIVRSRLRHRSEQSSGSERVGYSRGRWMEIA
jgi:hypothetical protein